MKIIVSLCAWMIFFQTDICLMRLIDTVDLRGYGISPRFAHTIDHEFMNIFEASLIWAGDTSICEPSNCVCIASGSNKLYFLSTIAVSWVKLGCLPYVARSGRFFY
jgi:hypothetical protein